MQSDIRRGVAPRRPIDTRLRRNDLLHIRSRTTRSKQRVDLRLSGVPEPSGGQDGRREVPAFIALVVRSPLHLEVLEGMCNAYQGRGIEAVGRQPAALVVRSTHEHRIRMRSDPLLHEAQDLIIHYRIMDVGGGIVWVARVVDARGLNPDKVPLLKLPRRHLLPSAARVISSSECSFSRAFERSVSHII